jgi:hypothetical protein
LKDFSKIFKRDHVSDRIMNAIKDRIKEIRKGTKQL